MNRKQRRANEKALPLAAPAATKQDTATMFQSARQASRAGDLKAATDLYQKILAFDPHYVPALDGLGGVYFAQGKITEASALLAQVPPLAPLVLEQFNRVLDLLVTLHPQVGEAMKKTTAAWPRLLTPDDMFGAGLSAVVGDPYLRTVLTSTVVRDLALERVLTAQRASILAAAASDAPATETLLAFCGALAQQCFINEYIWAVSAKETAELETLRAKLGAGIARGEPVAPLWMLALAMYAALYELPEAQALGDRDWPAPAAAVVAQQIREPREEQALRSSIPKLTAIGDGVTAKVRQQYEENPYPRWVLLVDAQRQIPVDEYLRHLFPAAPYRLVGEPDQLDILVAGCGTGRYALELAQSYRNANVLGVDLSLASLASAKRRAPSRLAGKIEFAQADIFKIAAIERRFDLINASGVLHHTADPLGAWRELLKLLKPNGVMQVGLYSTYGRRDVLATRALVAERGYQSTVEGIRRCRQDLLSEPQRFGYMQWNDFFSTSDCRDLLFHVHEQQFTIPEIKAFITDNGLNFIGFEIKPDEMHRQLRQHFTANGWSLGDLDRWDALERDNPDMFSAMYGFWIQKN
jgi:SAM-dependent methyltransferase